MPGGYSYLYKGTQGAKEHGEEAINVITDVIQWGRKKGLGDPKAQLNKVIEEVGEIAHEISRNNYDLDALGDIFVTLIILADILGYDLHDCLHEAYETIKDRSGHTSHGSFIKDGPDGEN